MLCTHAIRNSTHAELLGAAPHKGRPLNCSRRVCPARRFAPILRDRRHPYPSHKRSAVSAPLRAVVQAVNCTSVYKEKPSSTPQKICVCSDNYRRWP